MANLRRVRRYRWTRWRRACQAAVAVFYLTLPWFTANGLDAIAGTLAALKVGPVDLVEPAAGLSAVLAGARVTMALVVGMVPVVALAVVAGPVFCSWICPWSPVSEWLDRRRFRGRRAQWPDRSWVAVRTPRAVALGVGAVLTVLIGLPLASLLSAPRLLTTLPIEIVHLRQLSVVTGSLIAGLLVLEVIGPRRWWCRALCPVGAVANYLRTPRTLTIGYRAETCTCRHVPLCHLRCQWGLDPRAMGRFDGCTNCLACVDGCPSGSLTLTTRGPASTLGIQPRLPAHPRTATGRVPAPGHAVAARAGRDASR